MPETPGLQTRKQTILWTKNISCTFCRNGIEFGHETEKTLQFISVELDILLEIYVVVKCSCVNWNRKIVATCIPGHILCCTTWRLTWNASGNLLTMNNLTWRSTTLHLHEWNQEPTLLSWGRDPKAMTTLLTEWQDGHKPAWRHEKWKASQLGKMHKGFQASVHQY